MRLPKLSVKRKNTYLLPNASEAENDSALPLQTTHSASFSKMPSTLLSTELKRKAAVI